MAKNFKFISKAYFSKEPTDIQIELYRSLTFENRTLWSLLIF